MFSAGATYFLMISIVYIIVIWGALIPFRAGLLYNGTVYCMAIGGYFAGYMSKTFGWPFLACVIGAALIGVIFGFIPALGFSRTSGIVTAVSSMALIFIIQSVLRNLQFVGGSTGMTGVPKVNNLLLWSFITLIIMGIIMYRLNNSRIGRALEAIQTDPHMAQALGINTRNMVIMSLTIASAFAGVAGALYAFNLRVLYPGTYTFALLLNIMTMLFVGGRHTMWGPIVSVPLLWAMTVFMPPEVQRLSKYIYALILILILMLRPEGIITRSMLHKTSTFFRFLINKTKSRIPTKSQ